MEMIDKKINDELNKELEANESNRVDDFKVKSKRRFFATISGYIDKDWYLAQNPDNTEESWERYCNKATEQLQSNLKRLGLEYQKILGAWEGGEEKSFLVWNTYYTFEQFQALMLKLNKDFKQWAICIGKWVEDKYAIDLWQTNSLDKKMISYKIVDSFTKISPKEAIHQNWTVLTRHTFKENNEPSIAFEEIERNISMASSWSQWGAYKRGKLLKEFLGDSKYGND